MEDLNLIIIDKGRPLRNFLNCYKEIKYVVDGFNGINMDHILYQLLIQKIKGFPLRFTKCFGSIDFVASYPLFEQHTFQFNSMIRMNHHLYYELFKICQTSQDHKLHFNLFNRLTNIDNNFCNNKQLYLILGRLSMFYQNLDVI